VKAPTTNLLLLAVVITLLLLALYEPGIEVPAAPEKLLSLSAEEVTEIVVKNSLQQQITLRRESPTAWRMVEPLQVSANRYKVESLLEILQQQPTNRFAVNHENLQSYGLEKPQIELLLNGEQRLLFGTQTPLNAYRYLQLGDEIVTIKDSAFYPVASLYTNFIASRLLPEGAQLASIRLPDYLIHFSEGAWRVDPLREGLESVADVSADHLAQWLDGWRYASSVDIDPIADDHAATGLGAVIITLQSGDELRWLITNLQDGLTLARPDLGIEYHLSDSQRAMLLTAPQPQFPLQEPEVKE
jgi:hypothetical protein